ncbi:MAG TPA: phage Gp37/Gp68 family protein [Chloroflexota bacterium]|nr:phage Gp37/Gp68 family protein [Chloroflexota bacterium]
MSRIAWTNETWNPLAGCARVSSGCAHCYAIRDAHRMAGHPNPKTAAAYADLTFRHPNGSLDWTGMVRLLPERLTQPLRWTKPRRIFVNSLSDPFHRDVPDEYLAHLFAIMALAPQHTFQVLTKRPARMAEWVHGAGPRTRAHVHALVDQSTRSSMDPNRRTGVRRALATLASTLGPVTGLDTAVVALTPWPLPNVWLGVSVEDQNAATARVPHLLNTPAALRFLSCEPLLSPLILDLLAHQVPGAGPGTLNALTGEWWPSVGHAEQENRGRDRGATRVDWVIAGGESGPHARPMDPHWARSLHEQCRSARVSFFFKQAGEALARTWGCTDRKGAIPLEWPEAFRIQDYPAARAGGHHPADREAAMNRG